MGGFVWTEWSAIRVGFFELSGGLYRWHCLDRVEGCIGKVAGTVESK